MQARRVTPCIVRACREIRPHNLQIDGGDKRTHEPPLGARSG